ncbi:MAG: right-handed parallel beta-helix repeat-containing protein [Sedimentisphaerales bacterium]|nr:right-handed parallel beta-helix repeat-containing protein [Sedimentisphaerales bacterium]
MIVNKIILPICIALFFTACLVSGDEQESLCNFKNPEAVGEVLSGKRSVANAAWWGFNSEDSTEAIQGAINSRAQTVIIPYVGRDWVVRPIKLISNQEIFFEPGVVVTAKKGEFKGKYDCLFSAHHLSNVTLRGYGTTLRMQKADYMNSAKYTKSEHRHIVQIRSSENIKILGFRLENSGGDGIFVGPKGGSITAVDEYFYVPCRNVAIKDCICDNNYRQGISVISVNGLLVDNCILKNTRGTPPQAGIDLEPSNSKGILSNIVISNCVSDRNSGPGMTVNIDRLGAIPREISILFVNCYVKNCEKSALSVFAAENTNNIKGLIEFKNCVCENINHRGINTIWEKVASPITLRFSKCKFRNVAIRKNDVPFRLLLKTVHTARQNGGIEIVDCYLYDEKKRPCLKITDRKGYNDIYDIKGDIYVYNPYGATVDSGITDKKMALKIHSLKRTQW